MHSWRWQGAGFLWEEGTGLFEWLQISPGAGTVLGKLAWTPVRELRCRLGHKYRAWQRLTA